MDDLIGEFIEETSDALAVLDRELVQLDQNPNDANVRERINRLVHTIKGASGFLGLPNLENVAREVEQLLSGGITEQNSFLVLEMLSRIKHIVQHLEKTGEEPPLEARPAAVPVPAPAPPAFREEAPSLPRPELTAHRPLVVQSAANLSEEGKKEALRFGLQTTGRSEPTVDASTLKSLIATLATSVRTLVEARNKIEAGETATPLRQLAEVTHHLQESWQRAQPEAEPLTVRSLMVEHAGQRFALPQEHITELLSLADGSGKVEVICNTRVLLTRGRVIPLVNFSQILGRPSHAAEDDFVVVMRAGAAEFGLCIERMEGLSELAPEKLPGLLKAIGLYNGVATDGHGNLVLMMDAAGMARAIGFKHVETAKPVRKAPAAETRGTFLLFMANGAPRALPLVQVLRVEEFEAEALQFAGSHPLVMHRGEAVPLVTLPGTVFPRGGSFECVLLRGSHRPLGLLIERVLDIAHAPFAVQPGNSLVAGQVSVNGRMLEVLNADYFTSRAREFSA